MTKKNGVYCANISQNKRREREKKEPKKDLMTVEEVHEMMERICAQVLGENRIME